MLNYWYVWPIGIAIWFALGWGVFATFEAKALRHGARKDQITLSMFCYTIGSKFPLSILLAGLIIGGFVVGLGVHFFWHWCPPGSVSTGFLYTQPDGCRMAMERGRFKLSGCTFSDTGNHLTLTAD